MRWLSWGRIAIGAIAIASLATAWWQYRSGLIDMGRAECQAKVARAIKQQQEIANENAAIYEAGRADRQTEIRYRTREVISHVPSDRSCDWSPDAFRVLNDAITGAEPAGEPGRALPGSSGDR